MSVMAHATRDPLGLIDAKIQLLLRRPSVSTVNDLFVADTIRKVLADWDACLDTLEPAPLPVAGVEVAYPQDPLSAVEYLCSVLQLTQEQVIDAVGIRERTFFGWKTQGRRPRGSSLGRLWPMTDAIFYMARVHPNLAAWFHEHAPARAAFEAGEIDELVQMELAWTFARRTAFVPPAPDFGDGGTLAVTNQEDTAPAERPALKATPVAAAALPPQKR